MLTQAPKGTKDILPEQAKKWRYVEGLFREICAEYGFGEIRTPMFEHTELFVRGVGDTTDVVEKQMYSFDDLAGRNITLKPEGTSPAVRAFIENGIYAGTQPTKLYYITPCFRYEKMQKGRYRQFHQMGIEVFGSMDPLADAEVISVAADLLEKVGLKNYQLRINSVGCPKCRKIHREALKEFLRDRYDRLCDTCKGRYDKNPMRILDCKNGIEYAVDPWIVRGLDYYTKTAFEFVSTKGMAQGTVCGGGRYDHLVESLGGPDIPGVGYGMGMERLLLLLEEDQIELPEGEEVDYMILTMGEEARLFGARLTRTLRGKGRKVLMDLMGRNFKNQFKYANKMGVKKAIIIGEDEVKEGKLNVKDMKTGEQTLLSLDEADCL